MLQHKWSWFSILYVFLVLYLGCAGTSEEKQEVQETNPTNMPKLPQNKLAPGTAKIVAHMIKIEKEDNLHTCIFKVDKVLGYGMSTKPIGRGTEISLAILNDREDLINLLSDGTLEQKYELTVEQELMVDNQLKWKSVRIEKIDFEQ
jgi:hypothetical protein